MLTTVEGCYRDGVVELDERPALSNEARVLVTFLEPPVAAVASPPDSVEGDSIDDPEREAARKRILERMRKGYNLGGGPYYENREELHDRLERPWAGVR